MRRRAPGRAAQHSSGAYGNLNYGYLLAGSVIAMISRVILYLGLQHFFIRGLASGAVKG